MYPTDTKILSEAYGKAITGLVIGIDFDAKSICVGQNETTISCESRWIRAVTGEASLGDCTVIDFECGVAMPRVSISYFL